MDATAAEKAFAKSLVSVIGGTPTVHQYWDEAEVTSVAVLKCTNGPEKGLDTYCTLTVHRHPNMVSDRSNVRVELLAMSRHSRLDMGLPLSTAAFCIINSHWPCSPGTVFRDVYSIHRLGGKLRHGFFCPPIPWDKELGAVKVGQKEVHCLMMVPISDEEAAYAEDYGPSALENLLAKNAVDFADLKRSSTV